MNRRQFLKSTAAIPVIATGSPQLLRTSAKDAAPPVRRVRPGDPSWPSDVSWGRLRRAVRGRLITVVSPLTACQPAPEEASCAEAVKALHNPYAIGDQPGLTQTSGWVDAWTSAPSVYAVAAAETADVVAAVNFARAHHLRLAVKGGGHSYQGTCRSRKLIAYAENLDPCIL